MAGLHSLMWQCPPNTPGGPVVLMSAGPGPRAALRVVPKPTSGTQQHHHQRQQQQQQQEQFVYHQPVKAPSAHTSPPPHTLPHRHHSGLPARRSTNARRSLSRALSSRPQLQRSFRHKDSQPVLQQPPPQQQQQAPTPSYITTGSGLAGSPGSRPQSVVTHPTIGQSTEHQAAAAAAAAAAAETNKPYRQKSAVAPLVASSPQPVVQASPSSVAYSTVVISCPGDEFQQRRDTLWEYQSQHRGTSTTPAALPSNLHTPHPPQTADSRASTNPRLNRKTRAWRSTENLYAGDSKKSNGGSSSISPPDSISSSNNSRTSVTVAANLPLPDKSSPRLSPRHTVDKMPYRLRPLGEGATGLRSSSDTFLGDGGWSGCASSAAAGEGHSHPHHDKPAEAPSSGGEPLHLPHILPQFGAVYRGQDQRWGQNYTRAFSTTSHRSYADSADLCVRDGPSIQPGYHNNSIVSDRCSLTSSSFGPGSELISKWERLTSTQSNCQELLDNEDAYTDCSEDAHCSVSSSPYQDGFTEYDNAFPSAEQKFDTTEDVCKAEVSTSEPHHVNEYSVDDDSTRQSKVDSKSSSSSDPSEQNVHKADAETDCNQEKDRASSNAAGEDIIDVKPTQSIDASESTTQQSSADNSQNVPRIPMNGIITKPQIGNGEISCSDTNGVSASDECNEMVNNEGIEGVGDNREDDLEQVIQQESDVDQRDRTPPNLRSRHYKKRSYNLRELTAKFRTEMSKQCRSIIDIEEKEWFDDIVRSSRVVDDTSYDSYARKPLPSIKQTKLMSKVYNETQQSCPSPVPTVSNSKAGPAKPIQLFSTQNPNKSIPAIKPKPRVFRI